MSKVKYKTVTLIAETGMTHHFIYIGFERRTGFRWFPKPVLTVEDKAELREFAMRNDIKLEPGHETVNTTGGTYSPNEGFKTYAQYFERR